MNEHALGTVHGAKPWAWPWSEVRSALIVATAAVALVELIVLRVFTRTLVHIPGVDREAGLFTVVAEVGRFAYFAAVILLIALLAALAVSHLQAGRTWSAGAVALFAVFGSGARLGILDETGLPVVEVVAVAVLAASAVREIRSGRPAGSAPGGVSRAIADLGLAGLPIAALGVAAVLYGLWAVQSGIAAAGVGLPEATTVMVPIAEGLAVLGLALLPLSVAWAAPGRRLDRVVILVAVAVGLAVLAALVVADATTKILLLWNLGLSGYLPSAAYALAAAGATAGIVMALRSGRTEIAAAIALLLAGGFAVTSTYQSGLIIAAFGILALAFRGWPAGTESALP